MRFCFPGWFGPRHAGLGNELIPLAKAFIASRELGIPMLPTAWGLNDRGYRHYFGTSRFDWVRLYALSRALPRYTFREEDYLATGEADYGRAVRAFAKEKGLEKKGSYAFLTDGLWGAYYGIRHAKSFILRTLLNTRHTVRNLYEFQKRREGVGLLVAVHVRLTDFLVVTPETDYRGTWNTRLSLEWYMKVCRSIREALGDRARFLLMSDGTPDELREFLDEFQPLTTFDQSDTAVSDLLLLADADALVCSISSYSQWAAFLSGSPYIWYRPHLRPVGEYLTMWESIAVDPEKDGPPAVQYPRGVPVDDGGEVPTWLLDHLVVRAGMNRASTDLVRNGGVLTR